LSTYRDYRNYFGITTVLVTNTDRRKSEDMANKEHYTTTIINGFYNQIPAFEDIFDEESFYLFIICFMILTFIVVYILSKFIKLRPVDW